MTKEKSELHKITAFLVGRIQNRARGRPDSYCKDLIKKFPVITEFQIITGEWDVLLKLKVQDMEEYYHNAWSIAKYLDLGWGTIVSKTLKE